MEKEVRSILVSSAKTTVLLCIPCALACGLFASGENWILAALSVFYGGALALFGLYLIGRSSQSYLSTADKAKKKAAIDYGGRYLFYAAALIAGALLHLSPLGMLAGIMIQKASLLLYARCSGKEIQ